MPSFPTGSVQDFVAYYENAVRSARNTRPRPRRAPQINPTQILNDWMREIRNAFGFDYPMYCRFARTMRSQYGYDISSPPCTETIFYQQLSDDIQPESTINQEIVDIDNWPPAEPTPHIADFTHPPIINIGAFPAELNSFFRGINNGFFTPIQTQRSANTNNIRPSIQMFLLDGNNTVIINRITHEFILTNSYQLPLAYYLFIRELMTDIYPEIIDHIILQNIINNTPPRIINSDIPNRSLLNATRLQSLGEKVSEIPDRFLDSLDCQIMDEPVQLLGIVDSPEGMEDWVIVGVLENAVYDQGTLNRLRHNPYTRAPLSDCVMIPKDELKTEIDAFVAVEMAKNPPPVAPLATKQFYYKPH